MGIQLGWLEYLQKGRISSYHKFANMRYLVLQLVVLAIQIWVAFEAMPNGFITTIFFTGFGLAFSLVSLFAGISWGND